MWSKLVLHYADLASVLICISVILLLLFRKEARKYAFLLALVATRGIMNLLALAFLFYRRDFGLTGHQAYQAYFYTYWPSAILQLAFQLLAIYAVYRIAMRPLDGLKRIGTVIFAWVATVSILLSVVVALGPHSGGFSSLSTLIGQVQQGVSVLTVCLLVFVCFAARPLGLDFRSRGFGVMLGLGIDATAGLVLSAWFDSASVHSLYAPVFACGAIAGLASMIIWGVYFALPEPVQRYVVLPTTSPYFLWNSISAALGDNPGVVAIAGFTPARLASAEMLALTSSLPNADGSPTFGSAAISPAMAAGF